MPNLNKVMLMGNLTRDPELRYTPSNTPVTNIGIAVNRTWFNKATNERQEETTFVDCEAWGRTAEVMSQYLAKGRPVFVEGRLRLDQWKDRDGGNRSKLKVVIESFQFIDSRGGEPGPPGYATESQGRPQQGPPRRQPAYDPSQEYDQQAYQGPPNNDPHQPIEEDDIPF